MADREREERLDEAAGIRPGPGWHDEDAPRIDPELGRPRMLPDVFGYPAGVGDEAYTELARLRSAADPERDSRREAYRERERRRAARALDRYMEIIMGDAGRPSALTDHAAVSAAGERFIEQVGDYVLSRLQQKSHYGASGALFGADAHGGRPDGIGSRSIGSCDWPAMQCTGHQSHAEGNPCSNGRCPDPAAHAEGAHDL